MRYELVAMQLCICPIEIVAVMNNRQLPIEKLAEEECILCQSIYNDEYSFEELSEMYKKNHSLQLKAHIVRYMLAKDN